jgi:hypothetical protein
MIQEFKSAAPRKQVGQMARLCGIWHGGDVPSLSCPGLI